MKLTSVKMQLVVIDKKYFDEWYMPLLRFGKGKKNEFKMGLFIKGEDNPKVHECYERLSKFIGKTKDELIEAHDLIVQEFNEYKS